MASLTVTDVYTLVVLLFCAIAFVFLLFIWNVIVGIKNRKKRRPVSGVPQLDGSMEYPPPPLPPPQM